MQNGIIAFHLELCDIEILFVLQCLIFIPSCSPHVLVPDYLIGTVHQAKGLEFDTVLLADDFVQVPALGGNYQIRTDSIIGKGTAWCGPHPDLEVRSKPVLISAIRCHCQGIIDLVVSFTAR